MSKQDNPKLITERTRWQATAKRGYAYYAAYGSNLNLAQMRIRCPKAQRLTKFTLSGWKLVFRGAADIVRDERASVPVGVFRITPECERALDRYEGYPHLYTKATAKLEFANGDVDQVMFYVMNGREYQSGPGQSYFGTIQQGYRDFGMSDKAHERLIQAAAEAEEYEFSHLRNRRDLVRTEKGRYRPAPKVETPYRHFEPTAESFRNREQMEFPMYDEDEWNQFCKEYGIDPAQFLDDETSLSDLIDTMRSYE